MSRSIFKIKAKLGDLFPPDDPNSPWLLRLAILRDDFEYEIMPKGDREGDLSGAWMSFYWWRKRAITIGEVKHIFSHDMANYVKRSSADWRPEADPTPKVLQRHCNEEFEVVLDLKTSEATSLCHVTATAFMFAWSDATTQGDYVKLRTELHEKFTTAFNAVRHGIDLLLAIQWEKAGLLK